MRVRFISLLLPLVMISACQSTPPARQKAEARTPAVIVKPVVVETRVAALPSTTQAPSQPEKPAAKAVPVFVPPSLGILHGKNIDEVTDLLGAPSLRRKDALAEVWQYASDVCSMHIFFYPGPNSRTLVVDHVAVNGKSLSAETIDPDRCFEGQLRAAGTLEKLRTSS